MMFDNHSLTSIISNEICLQFTITDRVLVLFEGRQVALRYTAESVSSEIVDLIVGTNRPDRITPVVWALESYHATQKQTDELRRTQLALHESLEAQALFNQHLLERLCSQIQALDRLGVVYSELNAGSQAYQALNSLRETELITLVRVLIAQGRLQPDGDYLQEALVLLERLVNLAKVNHHSKRRCQSPKPRRNLIFP